MFDFNQVRYKQILDLPQLSIQAGKVTSIVGPSGSGKTTLLRLLNKMVSPTQGKIYYQGKDLEKIDSILHRREVVMLPQNPLSFAGTVSEELNAGLVFQQRQTAADSKLVEILSRLKLNKELDAPTDKLSGGELQRLALGRVMLLDAPVYLLDEPSSALDSATEKLIIEQICSFVCENKKTLVMVTHSPEIARQYSDQIIEIDSGRHRNGQEDKSHG